MWMSLWKHGDVKNLVDMGLVKHIGMSNMTIPKLNSVTTM